MSRLRLMRIEAIAWKAGQLSCPTQGEKDEVLYLTIHVESMNTLVRDSYPGDLRSRLRHN